jgi:hypothetical protein
MIQEAVAYIKENKLVLFLTAGVLFLLIIFMILYRFQTGKQNSSIQETVSQKDAQIIPENFNSTFSEKKTILQEYDERIAAATDKNEINNLLLTKVTLSTAVRGTSDSGFENMEEMKKVFLDIYNDKNSLQRHKAFVVLGYLNQFISRCFYAHWAEALPQPFLSTFQSGVQNNTNKITSERRKGDQKIAFSVFSDFADNANPNISLFKNDRSLMSYRLFINAIYFESFHDTLSKDELAMLKDRVKNDAIQYSTSDMLSYRTRQKAILMPAMFYAYGYDVYRSLVMKDTSSEANALIDKNYENVYLLTSSSTAADKVSDDMTNAFTSLFYVSSLDRRYGYENKSQKVEEVVARYENAITGSPETREVLAGYVRYSFSEYGSWNNSKKYLFSVATKSEKLKNIFNSHGINDANIKKISSSK